MMQPYLRLFLLVAFVVALSCAPVRAHQEKSCTKIVKNASPIYNYVIVSGCKSTGYTGAKKACASLHGTLADVNYDNTIRLSGALGDRSPAWIHSWNGDDYQGACIALYRNGAIAIPEGDCYDRHSFICQVPKKVHICPNQKCRSEDEREEVIDEEEREHHRRCCRKYREERDDDDEERDHKRGREEKKCHDGKRCHDDKKGCGGKRCHDDDKRREYGAEASLEFDAEINLPKPVERIIAGKLDKLTKKIPEHLNDLIKPNIETCGDSSNNPVVLYDLQRDHEDDVVIH